MSEQNEVQAGKQTLADTLGNLPEGAGSLLRADPKERTEDVAEAAIQEEVPVEVVETEEPAAEVKEDVETNESDEDAWLSEEDQGDDTDTELQEDTGEVSSEVRKLKINGLDVEVSADQAFDLYQRMEGRQDALQEKEQEIAETRKRLEAEAATLDYFKAQGELAPEYYAIEQDKAQLKDAEQAWAKGEDYNGISNDDLEKLIKRASFDLNARTEAFNEKAGQYERPGTEVLLDKQPDISKKGPEFFDGLEAIGEEFGYGFTERENADFRQLALVAEIADLRAFKTGVEEKRQAYAAKRQTKGKVATKATPPKSSKQAPDPQETAFTTDDLKFEGDGRAFAKDWAKVGGSALIRK